MYGQNGEQAPSLLPALDAFCLLEVFSALQDIIRKQNIKVDIFPKAKPGVHVRKSRQERKQHHVAERTTDSPPRAFETRSTHQVMDQTLTHVTSMI